MTRFCKGFENLISSPSFPDLVRLAKTINFMKKITIQFLVWSFFVLLASGINGQELALNWKFETSARVLASPVENNGLVYVGDIDGVFYAVDLKTGKEKWKKETDGNIQAKALIVGDNVFFESANVFYLVKGSNGKEVWKYETGMDPLSFTYKEKTYNYKIDPFDDVRSIPSLVDGVIYIGSGNGTAYGLKAQSGEVELEVSSDENSPIRSSPLVSDGKLYFGDWNGVVYCYDLASKDLLWKKKTYRKQLYGTFGGVVSEFVTYKDLLFFGARNHQMNVLDAKTGEKEWTYTDADGGWMIGSPVFYNDTLYIGGSDNFSMFAFEPLMGKPIWKQNGKKNIYTKPIVTEQWVLYTAGNSYNTRDIGKLFLLDRMSGEEIISYEVPNGTFSSPILVDNSVVFGCYDNNMYCVKVEE